MSESWSGTLVPPPEYSLALASVYDPRPAATRPVRPADGEASDLISIETVARMLDVSTRQVRRLADAGRMPRPLRIGRLIRWRRHEILTWIESGCPRK